MKNHSTPPNHHKPSKTLINKKLKEKYGDSFDLSEYNKFKNSDGKLLIRCITHGVKFMQTIDTTNYEIRGCPFCTLSLRVH